MLRPVHPDPRRVADAYARGLWISGTLADSLRLAAAETPGRELLVDGQTRLDCATLYRQSRSLAAQMTARMPVGSVVSFMLPNWHEAAVVYHAATAAGMVVNPILPSLRDHELGFILADADSRMIVIPGEHTGHDFPAMLDRVAGRLSTPPDVVVVRGSARTGQSDYADLIGDDHPAPEPAGADPDSVRMVLYTSGTTGRPKGVLHTHNSIHALITQIGANWHVDPGDTFLVPSPIAHIGGSIYAFECPLLLETTAVLQSKWDAAGAVGLMTGERCTHMAGATPFLEQLLTAAEAAGTRLPHLKVFICGGASVPPSLIRRATQYFDHAVVTRVYGSTEVPVTTVGTPEPTDSSHAADTDGHCGIAEIKLAPHPAAPAGSGEILARGPQMLAGYLHPEDDVEAFDGDGFFRTGDIGCWVDERYLVVTGRAKDVIIRNGENISPKEIEDLLIGLDGVAEVAVVGLPDERTGERACAVVVTDDPPGPDLSVVRDYLQSRGVARFKTPEQIAVWDSLPKNDAGKVLKHQIRARLASDT